MGPLKINPVPLGASQIPTHKPSKEKMTNDEKRTIRTTHTYEALLDGGGQSHQTAWASAPRGRWRWRSSAQSSEQANKRAKRSHADWQPVENMTRGSRARTARVPREHRASTARAPCEHAARRVRVVEVTAVHC